MASPDLSCEIFTAIRDGIAYGAKTQPVIFRSRK